MDESQDMIYEESEVLWAKIRGYPWWPAYVPVSPFRSVMCTRPMRSATTSTPWSSSGTIPSTMSIIESQLPIRPFEAPQIPWALLRMLPQSQDQQETQAIHRKSIIKIKLKSAGCFHLWEHSERAQLQTQKRGSLLIAAQLIGKGWWHWGPRSWYYSGNLVKHKTE